MNIVLLHKTRIMISLNQIKILLRSHNEDVTDLNRKIISESNST